MAHCRTRYYNDIAIFQTAQYILSDCADITFLNSGASNINVNGIILLPNQSLAFTANVGEMDTTKYYIYFLGAGTSSATVIRKYYIS